MAKIGILVPHMEMLTLAEEVLKEASFSSLREDIVGLKRIETVDSISEARRMVEEGAEILIARGYQALLIRKYTNIPLAEMRIHAEKIGFLLRRAKRMCDMERPKVSLVVFENMCWDMNELGDLFDVNFNISYLPEPEAAQEVIQRLIGEGTDVFIGGDRVCREAEAMGQLALRYGSSKEALREAFREAERMSFAIETEKQTQAQMETMMETTFHGIIRINGNGVIIVANRIVGGILEKSTESVKGMPVWEVFPDFEEKEIRKILEGRSEYYTTTLRLKKEPWVLLVAPILYNDQVTGAILSLEKIVSSFQTGSNLSKDTYLSGFVADMTFERLQSVDEEMVRQLELGKRFAMSERPILIYAQDGLEDSELAECIHNNSRRKQSAFVRLSVDALAPQFQEKVLFGQTSLDYLEEEDQHCALFRANRGTLFLRGIEKLTPQSQSRLLQFLQKTQRVNYQGVGHYQVRFIFSTRVNLKAMVEEGEWNEELFYLCQGLTLTIPSLRRRLGDLNRMFEEQMKRYTSLYGKYLVLTQGARREIERFSWDGNWPQLDAFTERLVLSADKRSIDEVYVRNIYEELFPRMKRAGEEVTRVVYGSEEADHIRGLLGKYQGNRQAVAKELGISTTTLWRKMKRFGIQEWGTVE